MVNAALINPCIAGDKLKKLRIDSGETLETVARACGITRHAVSQYESGDRFPKDDIKLRLANHFDVTVQSIFYT